MVLVMELTGRDRSFILPMILAVVTATVVARSLDARSIYDARFTDREIESIWSWLESLDCVRTELSCGYCLSKMIG